VKHLFLDTSFLLALVLLDDEHHERALAWQRKIQAPLLTTEYVLLELADALCAGDVLRHLAVSTIDLLKSDASVSIVAASTPLLDEGLEFFRRRPDKRWSLTDCISFVVMQGKQVTEALSSDHHFEQAGFSALLRRDPA
jgi:predicted nucleic acid-binding protein